MNDQIKDAEATVLVTAPRSGVWEALTDPGIVKQYFLGTNLTTTWREGDPVTFAGEWKGKSYEDKGIVLENRPGELLRITHYSPLTGLPDVPENYHTGRVPAWMQDAGGHPVSPSRRATTRVESRGGRVREALGTWCCGTSRSCWSADGTLPAGVAARWRRCGPSTSAGRSGISLGT